MSQPCTELLDTLCPMHLMLDAQGLIRHAGPTIAKLHLGEELAGERFLDRFDVKRPRRIASMDDLRRADRLKLHLRMRGGKRTELKGIAVPLNAGRVIVNLSFGFSIIDGVRDYGLTNADFAATDLAIEMLYLMEAKTAAMEASRRLNLRLQGDKIAAQEQAFSDALTGLRNRRAMNTVLARLADGTVPFAVMQIDLDYFKAVNDTLGHAAGDHVLRRVASVMLEETRGGDTLCRVGGDEFTLIMPNVTETRTLERIGRRLIARIEEPVPFDGEVCRISASIGTVRSAPGTRQSAGDLLADADFALYASKRAGRARHTLYAPELRRRSGEGGSDAHLGRAI